MSTPFFDRPVLNSPYVCPTRHWELVDGRRPAEFVSPIPMAKRQRARATQQTIAFDEGHGLSDARQEYAYQEVIRQVRNELTKWRAVKNPSV